jgi:hypothetical protein
LNASDFTGKMGTVSCPVPVVVKSMKGNSCRSKQNVMKEILGEIAKCKYALNSKKASASFKGNGSFYFQITSDGYVANYKVLKTDIKPKSILKEIESQIKSIQFGKTGARDCVSEITGNVRLKVLTLKNKKLEKE